MLDERSFDPLETGGGFVDDGEVLLEGEPLRRVVELEIAQPPTMGEGPGALAGVAASVPKKEGLHLLAGLVASAPNVLAGTRKIADRLVLGLGDIEGSELAGAMEPGERFGIAAIGLDAIAGSAWDLRGADDGTGDLLFAQESIDLESARAGLVDEPELAVLASQPPEQFGDRLQVAGDGAEVPYLPCGAGFGDRHVDRFLVYVESYEGASLFHGLPPPAWLCAGWSTHLPA